MLASTKIDVHIPRYSEGPAQVARGEFWLDRLGKKSDIPFEDVIAWSELPRPFSPAGQWDVRRRRRINRQRNQSTDCFTATFDRPWECPSQIQLADLAKAEHRTDNIADALEDWAKKIGELAARILDHHSSCLVKLMAGQEPRD